MPCYPIDGDGGFACSRGASTRYICDVCDKTVRKAEAAHPWRGTTVDLCPRCKTRYTDDSQFREWADRIIAKHYPEHADGRP